MRKLLRPAAALIVALGLFAASAAPAGAGEWHGHWTIWRGSSGRACQFEIHNYTAWDPWGYGHFWAEASATLEGCSHAYPDSADFYQLWLQDDTGTWWQSGWQKVWSQPMTIWVASQYQSYPWYACVQWVDHYGRYSDFICFG